jgi:heme ABC exporter ATP-binding subunit CcmA
MAPAVLLRTAVAMTGRFPALAGVDLRVDQGEAVLLTGPNGAGKTSLLRVCAGLLRVTSGRVSVLGDDLVDDPGAARRDVALLGHASALYDDLTVAENVRFAVRAAGGDVRRVDGALERLGLVGRLSRSQAGRLSAGQRKRVALAVLVARGPRLWLLDEPHAALDASARAEFDLIVSEALSDGATALTASHEIDVSMSIATRVVGLAGGRVVSDVALSVAVDQSVALDRRMESGAVQAVGTQAVVSQAGVSHVGADGVFHVGADQVVVPMRGGPNVA